ncbi:MAG TPA: DUF1016 N-terminal domain-containing protein, partial [Blastocatellia bacterium]|nr:DUF1016 N-terminal domain-containing protein [Blastocatellia bacterium]
MNSRKAKQTSLKQQPPSGLSYPSLVEAIAQAHATAQRQAAQTVNLTLTLRNWLIGYHIVEYEQQGQDRAEYGERLLETLARDLKRCIGKGFTKRYLEMFRQFYLRYPIAKSVISQFGVTLPSPPSVEFKPLDWQDDAYYAQLFRRLPWTHFIELIRLDEPLKRAF